MNATNYLLHGIGYAMHANTVALVGVASWRRRQDQRDGMRGGRFAAAGWARPSADAGKLALPDERRCGKPRTVRESARGPVGPSRSPSPRRSGSLSPA